MYKVKKKEVHSVSAFFLSKAYNSRNMAETRCNLEWIVQVQSSHFLLGAGTAADVGAPRKGEQNNDISGHSRNSWRPQKATETERLGEIQHEARAVEKLLSETEAPSADPQRIRLDDGKARRLQGGPQVRYQKHMYFLPRTPCFRKIRDSFSFDNSFSTVISRTLTLRCIYFPPLYGGHFPP